MITRVILALIVLVLTLPHALAEGYPWHPGATAAPPDLNLRPSAAIELIEQSDGPFSPALYDPLRRTAIASFETGQVAAALAALQRMQTLIHRHEGVYSPHQIDSLRWQVKAYSLLGEAEQADRVAALMYRVAERAWTPGDARMHRARYRLARWYLATLRASDARELVDESLTLLRREENALLLVEALQLKAQTLFVGGRCCASEPLAEALALTMNLDGEADAAAVLHGTLVAAQYVEGRQPVIAGSVAGRAAYLGYPSSSRVKRANNPARFLHGRSDKIYFLNEPAQTGPAVGSPVAMCSHVVSTLVSPAELRGIRLQVAADIDATGRAREIEVTGTGPNTLKRMIESSLELGRFRPATDASGRAVPSRLVFEQRFNGEREPSSAVLVDWNRQLVAQSCHAEFKRQLLDQNLNAGFPARQASRPG